MGKVYAQQNPDFPQDSIRLYNDIKQYSNKNKFRKFIYSKVFRGPDLKKKKTASVKRRNLNIYSGKIIRNIKIQSLDPFGYDISDTTRVPLSVVQKAGNSLHNRSAAFAIRNYFLFKKNQPLVAYKISETERLMRRSGIFRDVIINPSFNKSSPDSVDLLVRVIDKWSITGNVTANPSSSRISITDKNFAGTGNEFTNVFGFNNSPFGLDAYSTIFSVNRIKNTYMNVSLYNVNESDGRKEKAIKVERPLFSPLTDWAGGAFLGEATINDKWYFHDTIVPALGITSTITDVFAARAFHLNKMSYDFTKEQVTYENLILSLRSTTQRIKSTGEKNDSLGLYKSRDFILGMVSLSLVGFETETYVLKFGEIEDVPIGLFYGVMAGIDHRNNARYLGMRFSAATITPSTAYYSFIVEGGKYYDYSYTNPSSLNAEITYYSPLLRWGKWNFRQFVRPRITFGWQQPLNKSLTLGDEGGIQGFTTDLVYGMNRANLSLQTQAYAPWNFIGFRFGPVLYFNCGMIADNRARLFSSNFYNSAGLGFLIKNDLLVLNSLQVSISFYPYIPGPNKTFKINAFRTVDFNIRDLVIDRPEFIEYR
jgi:hypothetical protein